MGKITDYMQDFKESTRTIGGDFQALYDQTLLRIRQTIESSENPQEANADKDKFYIRPSSLGQCARAIYYDKTKAERDPVDTTSEWSYNIQGILESGTDRHERIQAVLEEMEKDGHIELVDIEEHCKTLPNTEFVTWNEEHTEARCKQTEHDMYFQCDGLFNWKGEMHLFEIKTCSSYKLRKVISTNKPFPEHILQATAYAIGMEVDKVIFFYEGREFCRRHAIYLEITPAMKQKVIDRIHSIKDSIHALEVPPKEENKCMYCKYKGTCADEPADKELKFNDNKAEY